MTTESELISGERARTRRVRLTLERALEFLDSANRFIYLTPGETTPSFNDSVATARDKWEERKKSGVKGEIIAPIIFANKGHLSMYPNVDSNVYLARRARKVKRIAGDGKPFMKEVGIDEGGGMLVLHPMGDVSKEDFDLVAKLELAVPGIHTVFQRFEGVLLSGAFMRETKEEVDPTAAWNKSILSIMHRIFIHEPYFDTRTKMLIYPIACELSGIPHIKGEPVQTARGRESKIQYDPESVFEKYIELSEKYPEVEYDIVTGAGSETGFHQFRKIAQMVTERPNDFYPGTLKALTEVLKDQWPYPRRGPSTVTLWDVPKDH